MGSEYVVFGARLAHQGGWDEVLLIGAPAAIIIVIFVVAKRRVDGVADPDRVPPTSSGDD